MPNYKLKDTQLQAKTVSFTTLFGVFNIACNYISKFCSIFLLPKIKSDIDVHVAKERVY